MSRKGENIYKRKDKRWEARITVGYTEQGRKKYHSIYAHNYSEVKRKKQEYIVEHYEILRTLKPREKKKSGMPSFQECTKQWLLEQKKVVKQSTYSTYLRVIDGHLLPWLAEMEIDEIDSEYLKKFLQEKQENGRLDGSGGLAPKTVKDIAGVLNAIFTFCVEKYTIKNPMTGCWNTKFVKSAIDILSEKECQYFTNQIMKNITCDNIGILISLYTGLRLGEICALSWENINWNHLVIQVRHTVSRVIWEDAGEQKGKYRKTKLIVSSPKSISSVRDVPIPDFLVQPLSRLKEEGEGSGYLLTNGPKPMDPRTYQNHFKNYLKQSGIREIHFHSLRHTFATNCVILDFDIKTLSEILGHANTSITLEKYVHSSLHRKQLQMMKLSKLIASTL